MVVFNPLLKPEHRGRQVECLPTRQASAGQSGVQALTPAISGFRAEPFCYELRLW